MPDPKKQRAGRKGGQTVSKDRAHMAAIGRKGGQRSRIKRASQKQETASEHASQQTVPSSPVRESMSGSHDGHVERTGGEHAIELLKADHERVHSLFDDFETAGGEDKLNLADKIMRELEVHAAIEEEIFYPAFEAKADKHGKDLVAEARREHKGVKEAIKELRDMAPDGEAFESKFHEMMQDVQHHVGEEEGEMFPAAEEALGEALEELGTEMQKRKEELMESLTSGMMH